VNTLRHRKSGFEVHDWILNSGAFTFTDEGATICELSAIYQQPTPAQYGTIVSEIAATLRATQP
jgi:hypothetical protein